MSEFFQFDIIVIIIIFYYFSCYWKTDRYGTDTSTHVIIYVSVSVRHISDTEHTFG